MDVTVDGKHLKKVYVDYYTVSFNDEGGSLLRNVEKQVVRKVQKAAEPDFTPGKDNYSFKGWYWYADEELVFPSAIKSTTHGSPSFMRTRRKKIGSAFKISANATATQPTKMPAQKP